jgi:hypothetical protein
MSYREEGKQAPSLDYTQMIERMSASVSKDYDLREWVVKTSVDLKGMHLHISENHKFLKVAVVEAYNKYTRFIEAFESYD